MAVAFVVVYHVWPHLLPGGFIGVDIFFVISGYLITSHLVSRPPVNGADLVAFWARRARRLLPAALLVLLVTAVGVRVLAPETQWANFARETVAAAFYMENWQLAASSVDYLAAENAPSPVQHYWSLSVEEQFYILWPLLMLVAMRFRRRIGKHLPFVVIGLVLALSLGYSIHMTEASPASAYFITPTRMWELATGGMVALLPSLSHLKRSKWMPTAGAWTGLGAVCLASVTFHGSMPFPGYAAVLPVAGTALVIWAAADRYSPTAFLGWRPFQWLGGVSYSVYLWHWPLVVLVPIVFGSIGPLDGALIIAVTLALSVLTKKHIEDRYRRAPWGEAPVRSLKFAGIGMLCIGLVAAGQITESAVRNAAEETALASAERDNPCFGAAALGAHAAECVDSVLAQPLVSPAVASEDKPDIYADDCFSKAPYNVLTTCSYGQGRVEVALVGNSHAGQWIPALQKLASEHDWHITTFLASTCTATDSTLEYAGAGNAEGCLEWGRKAREATSGNRFDLVITSERNVLPAAGKDLAGSAESWQRGYSSYLEAWDAAGTNVLVLHDTPFPGNTVDSIPDCLDRAGADIEQCSASPEQWIPKDPLYAAAVQGDFTNVHVASLNDRICLPNRCHGILGETIVYFDKSHMTATFARTLAPFLEPAVTDALR